MFITLEQSRQEIDLAQQLASNLDILSIKLLSASLTRKSHAFLNAQKVALALHISFKAKKFERMENQLVAEVEFSCQIAPNVPEGEERSVDPTEPVIRMDCGFESVYNLAEGFTPTEEQLNSFLMGNAVYNCWSYFREFIQHAATRMELPPPPIPFLRVGIKTEMPEPTK